MKEAFFLFFMVLIVSCQKDPDIHVIEGNVAPPDYTVETEIIQVYINKTYISLLGREPDETEYDSNFSALTQSNFSIDSRIAFIENVYTKQGYFENLDKMVRDNYIRGIDSLQMANDLFALNLALQSASDPFLIQQINFEIDRLEKLKNIVPDLSAGLIDISEVCKRVVDNLYYDDFNMGTENFVTSSFNFFFYRYPTEEELWQAELMVDGFPSTFLLEVGESKEDYMQIFFSSNEYYEGRVRFLFNRFMFREPTSAEMAYFSELYKDNDYHELQKQIIALDEYAGL